ncbi:MAG: hypothetical protein AAF908_04835 [Pseudomonadota bacterium]
MWRSCAKLLEAACLAALPALALAEPQVSPADVLDAVSADWSGDGRPDRAVLVAGAIDADLYLYIADAEGMTLAAHAPGLAWSGRMAGTLPRLELTERGALQVISENAAIGRYRWERRLTLLYREGRFVVGGVTLTGYDTLELGSRYACDLNLFTGRGVANGTDFTSERRAEPVTTWDNTPVCPGR